jgi:hypothetical protein
MHANLPVIANRWEKKYGLGGVAELNAELNSLPEYYLPFPAAQGGRIGFEHGSGPMTFQEYFKGKSKFEFDKTREDMIREYEEYLFRQKYGPQDRPNVAQGGLIPAHQAGIYGLAEGGQLVKPGPGRPGYGGPQDWGQEERQEGPYSPDVSPEVDHGGDDGGVPDFESGSAQNTYAVMSPEMAEKAKAETERVLGDHGDPMGTSDEAAKYARYLKYQVKNQVNKEDSAFVKTLKFIGKAAAVVGTGGTALGLGELGIVKFANVVNDVNKLSNTFVKGYNFLNKTNYTKTELFNKIQTDAKNRKKMNYELDKDPSGLDHGKFLVKKPVIDHGDNGQTNGTITESLKTKQMEEASRLAVIRQKELRDKQMAYWREMMKPYMSAKGGRVPGYNTGGLSNLFRLKTA